MRNCLRVLILLVSLVFVFSGLSCQKKNDSDVNMLTPKQMRADADYFFQTIQRIHPDIYHYCGLVEFEIKKKEIYDKLNFQLTAEEFYQTLSTINSCLDDHSGISIAIGINYIINSNKEWLKEIWDNKSKNVIFPRIFFQENKIFTLIDNEMEEILSINGIDINDIVSFIKPRLINWSERKGQILVENFFPFWLYGIYKINSPFVVEHKNGKTILQGISLSEYANFFHLIKFEPSPIVRSKIYHSSSIALVSINSFYEDDLKADNFHEKMVSFFDSIQECGIKTLFIDLTKNEGGQLKPMFHVFDFLQHDTIFWGHSSITQKTYFTNSYELYRREIIRLPQKEKNLFNGELFVLQSGSTLSGADYLCRIVSLNNFGKLIGQNTGGLTVGFSSNQSFVMPNSKLPFKCATLYRDFSHDCDTETFEPDMYWDTDYVGDFSEEELKKILDAWNEQEKKP
jgi:hypothetical protein